MLKQKRIVNRKSFWEFAELIAEKVVLIAGTVRKIRYFLYYQAAFDAVITPVSAKEISIYLVLRYTLREF